MPTEKANVNEKKSKKNTTSRSTKTKSKDTKKVKVAKSTARKPAVKKTTTSKKVTTSKSKTTRKKSTSTKKSTATSRKKASKSLLNVDLTKSFSISEYYDLPAKYEQTLVKVLAQTPDTLFVYWDISEADRKKFVDVYGDSFFYDTKPVLIITNKTLNYTFEIDINDFANCWYLHINNPDCEYSVELGRRPINASIEIPNNYLYISSSNKVEAPNDHILFEKKQNMVYFRNVKTNVVSSKPIINFNFLRNLGKYYNIYEFYEKAYKEDFSSSTKLMGNSSSVFK